MKLTSSAFRNGDLIPDKYARGHNDLSPPLALSEVPPEAKSLALIMDDPDAPRGTFTHWILFNLDPNVGAIHEDKPPRDALLGKNDWGEADYGGPRPPSGSHRYFFHGYALDCRLHLPNGASRKEIDHAMEGHVVGSAELMGRYAAAPADAGPGAGARH